MKYKEWLSFWLENYVKTSVKMRTFKQYSYWVKRRINPTLGEYEISEITPIFLQKYITELLQNGGIREKGLSVNTVNGIINIVQCSLKVAFEIGETDRYVGDKIKRPKMKEKAVSCFTVEEQKKIEKAVFRRKNRKFIGIVICLYTGLRIGELMALTWSDIDFKKATLSVNKACYDGKDGNGKYTLIIDTPKTKSSVRIIPIPKQLLPILRELRKVSHADFVITNNGKNILVRSYQESFALLLKNLGISHRGFHSLRHTFATRALECGMDVKTLSEILGHKNPIVTLNRYSHSMLRYKKEMMNKIGNLL